MTSIDAEQEPIISSFAGDPVLSELVEMYVAEMPDRIADLERAFAGGDRERLRIFAHQIKGAAGSYGFDCLTQAAASLETSLRADRPAEEVGRLLDELLKLCRRISAGGSQ
jgi:HPt (histidine-containing phosphotransfer) domain-containing protein